MSDAVTKLGIEEVQADPNLLRVAPDQELLNLHRRLHQQYGLARERGEATEYPWVNVHTWVVQEMRRRGFNHNINDDLDRETERLMKGEVPEWLARRLAEAKEAILVPAYVSVVGSATRGDKTPADLDVLVREDESVLTKGWRESVMLLVRKLLDPEKTGLKLHILANPQGPHLADGQGYVPVFDLVLRPRVPELVTKAALKPIAEYQAMKPWMAGYTDFRDVTELWENWAKEALAEARALYVSPKVDGFRTILQRDGKRVSIRFEDLGEERSDELPELAEQIPDGSIIEGELCVVRNGRFVARPQILSVLAGKELGEPYVFLYDVLVWDGQDVHDRPFSERLPLLRKVKAPNLIVLPQAEVRSQEELEDAAQEMANWRWRFEGPPVEGVVVRKASMPYTFGATNDYAKTKKGLELKVKVVAVNRKANGWTYTAALRGDDGDVILGDTFVSKERLADVGDTLNVLVEELLLNDKGELSWGKPMPMGPDRSRPAYTVEQAIDLARRLGVLKEYVPATVKAVSTDTAPAIGSEEAWVEIEADDLPRRGHFTAMGSLRPYMDRILRFVPTRGIKRIVEPFCGPGELIWFARAQEHVLADIDPDIVRLHRICRDLKEEDYERLRRFKWVGDENYYNQLWDADPPEDDIEFYHRELYLRRFGKRGREDKGFQPDGDGIVFNWEPRVRAAQRRLRQNVRILRADFRVTLRRFDAPDTFFFLDPPWPSRENMRCTPGHGGYYRYDNPPVEEIAQAMRQLKGKAMLIIEGKGDQLKPLREAGFYERKFAWRHPWAASGAGDIQPLTYVSIFTNYDPDSVSKRAESDEGGSTGSAKTLKQPLRSPGGKTRIANKLLALLPPHETYVEPYAGGAALFWRKAPSKREVLNDINPDIMSVYQFLQKASDAELEEFARRDWVAREELFERLFDSEPRSLADRAYRAWYLSRFGRHGPHSKRGDFQHIYEGQRAAVTFERLKELRERLRDTILTVGDALDIIKRYDGPDTFFYIDPPYLGANAGYQHGPDPEHIAQLGALLRQLKGKALVSGNYETIKALGLPSSWVVKRVAIQYSLGDAQPGNLRYEFIAANYPIAKALEEDNGETRSEAALRNWEENWQEAMPLSGKAQAFILHAHWRGLTEGEAQLSMDDLLKTGNSLHFDLRLGTDRFNGWWGITLFAGTTEDNRDELRIFRMMDHPEEKLESAPKQFGPRPWLEVGKKEPLVVPPGGVGSTSKAWSKFFAIDWGSWRLGFARQHAVEIFLDGKRLRGRFLWQYAPLEEGGERQWLFTRPEDQRPYAQTHRLEDVIKELADKGQRWLVWPKDPNDLSKGHRLIDVQEEARRLRLYRILRSEDERRYTLGVVYPVREVDAHGDYTTPAELERAAWEYMRKSRKVGLMHRPGTEGAGEVVESYIYRGPPWEINGQVVEPGDWLMGVIWREDVWPLIKEGQITGFSLQGWARRNGR
jgi:site-specific DNA-adenine methylase